MAIILEGPDAAGKSTLARVLAGQFGMRHIVSGGAPHNRAEVMEYCRMQLGHCASRMTVIDRVTPISHPIYNPIYKNDPEVMDFRRQMLASGSLIVYCRPPTETLMRPEKHEWKDYDTEEHKQKILHNQMEYIGRYDEVFREIPHLPYDYTQGDDYAVELIAKLAASQNNDEVLESLRGLMNVQVKR